MIPVVALVGRPNVGKSTLYNCLTRSNDALVADYSGLTRDRKYGEATFNRKPFLVVDTGGLGVDDLAVDELMAKQTALAIEEADIVLFLVDGRSGRTPLDESIARTLRKCNKPIHLVVNKVDGLIEEVALGDFQKLGFMPMHAISASHSRGIYDLLEEVTATFPVQPEEQIESTMMRICFAGRPNVGKSTLINRILGEERVVVYDMPGTTRDSVEVPFSRDGKDYILVDTAGVRRRARVDEKIEKFSVIKTLQSIKDANVCLMLIDARTGVTEQDLHLIDFIIRTGSGLVIAVNKWDGLQPEEREKVKADIERRLHFAQFARVKFISALHGSGVGTLFEDLIEAYESAHQKLSTPKLTRLLEDLVSSHQPPLVQGRRIKLRYAHSGGHNPPVIVIHGNQVNELPDSYKRYLTKGFIEHLGLVGTPLKLEFKGGENPYRHKKNKLTERQIQRKRRMMKHVKKKK